MRCCHLFQIHSCSLQNRQNHCHYWSRQSHCSRQTHCCLTFRNPCYSNSLQNHYSQIRTYSLQRRYCLSLRSPCFLNSFQIRCCFRRHCSLQNRNYHSIRMYSCFHQRHCSLLQRHCFLLQIHHQKTNCCYCQNPHFLRILYCLLWIQRLAYCLQSRYSRSFQSPFDSRCFPDLASMWRSTHHSTFQK